MVSPIYFVSFVLTAQFVLVNVVIAVLMKHLEESNKEANENAEAEADLDLELQMDMGDMGARSPQLHPLVLGVDRSSSGGSPLRSTGEEGEKEPEPEREVLMDSPTVDITRDSAEMTEEPPPCLEPPAQVKTLFFSYSNMYSTGSRNLMLVLSGSNHWFKWVGLVFSVSSLVSDVLRSLPAWMWVTVCVT